MNVASFGGDDLYGGWIDVNLDNIKKSITYTDITEIFEFEGNNSVSSDPTRICMCTNNTPDCNITYITQEILPGQTFSIQFSAVGQRYGTIKSFISASLDYTLLSSTLIGKTNKHGRIGELERVQAVERSCTLIKYTIFSPNQHEQLALSPFVTENTPTFEQEFLETNTEFVILFKQLSVAVKIKDCPLAFI